MYLSKINIKFDMKQEKYNEGKKSAQYYWEPFSETNLIMF